MVQMTYLFYINTEFDGLPPNTSPYIFVVWCQSKLNILAFLLKARCIVWSLEDPLYSECVAISVPQWRLCVPSRERGGPVLTLNPGGVGRDKTKPVWKSVDHLRSHTKKTSPLHKLFLTAHFKTSSAKRPAVFCDDQNEACDGSGRLLFWRGSPQKNNVDQRTLDLDANHFLHRYSQRTKNMFPCPEKIWTPPPTGP